MVESYSGGQGAEASSTANRKPGATTDCVAIANRWLQHLAFLSYSLPSYRSTGRRAGGRFAVSSQLGEILNSSHSGALTMGLSDKTQPAPHGLPAEPLA